MLQHQILRRADQSTLMQHDEGTRRPIINKKSFIFGDSIIYALSRITINIMDVKCNKARRVIFNGSDGCKNIFLTTPRATTLFKMP